MMMWLIGMLRARRHGHTRARPRVKRRARKEQNGARARALLRAGRAQHELHEEADEAHDNEAQTRAARDAEKLCRPRRRGARERRATHAFWADFPSRQVPGGGADAPLRSGFVQRFTRR